MRPKMETAKLKYRLRLRKRSTTILLMKFLRKMTTSRSVLLSYCRFIGTVSTSVMKFRVKKPRLLKRSMSWTVFLTCSENSRSSR